VLFRSELGLTSFLIREALKMFLQSGYVRCYGQENKVKNTIERKEAVKASRLAAVEISQTFNSLILM